TRPSQVAGAAGEKPVPGVEQEPAGRLLQRLSPASVGFVARSEDGGRSWQQTQLPGKVNSTVWNFATHAPDPRLIYASSVSGKVYRSQDGGRSWEKLEREFGEVRALAWTP